MTDTYELPDAFDMGGGVHVADRLMGAQKLSSDVYLRGEKPPTARQVSAVLHALSEFSITMLMTGPEVRAIGNDTADHGEHWAQATGIGRWLHRAGDWLDRDPALEKPIAVPEAATEMKQLRVTVSVDTDDMEDLLAWAGQTAEPVSYIKPINKRWLERLAGVVDDEDEARVLAALPASLAWCYFSWRADNGAELRRYIAADNEATP
jgi:sugar/nucleoside kinase (ribokinase family)